MSGGQTQTRPDQLRQLQIAVGKLKPITGAVLVVTYQSGSIGHYQTGDQLDALVMVAGLEIEKKKLLDRMGY